MTYALLSAVWIAATVAASLIVMAATRTRPSGAAVALTIVALIVLTAVFDTVMIAAGFFHYDPAHLLGIHVALAPLEDFAYPLAGAILLPVLWTALRVRRRARGADTTEESR